MGAVELSARLCTVFAFRGMLRLLFEILFQQKIRFSKRNHQLNFFATSKLTGTIFSPAPKKMFVLKRSLFGRRYQVSYFFFSQSTVIIVYVFCPENIEENWVSSFFPIYLRKKLEKLVYKNFRESIRASRLPEVLESECGVSESIALS